MSHHFPITHCGFFVGTWHLNHSKVKDGRDGKQPQRPSEPQIWKPVIGPCGRQITIGCWCWTCAKKIFTFNYWTYFYDPPVCQCTNLSTLWEGWTYHKNLILRSTFWKDTFVKGNIQSIFDNHYILMHGGKQAKTGLCGKTPHFQQSKFMGRVSKQSWHLSPVKPSFHFHLFIPCTNVKKKLSLHSLSSLHPQKDPS